MTRRPYSQDDIEMIAFVDAVAGAEVARNVARMWRTGLYGTSVRQIIAEALQQAARDFVRSGIVAPPPREGDPDHHERHVPLPKPPVEG